MEEYVILIEFDSEQNEIGENETISLFTDIFNIFNNQLVKSKKPELINDNYIAICQDIVDAYIFKFFYKNVYKSDIDYLNDLNIDLNDFNEIYINPKNVIENKINIFTIPNDDIKERMINYDLHSIYVNTNQYIKQNKMYITFGALLYFKEYPEKFNNALLEYNSTMLDIENFKLLLQILAFTNIYISELFYNNIKNYISFYSQYRFIKVIKNKEILNPFIYNHDKISHKTTYSITGIPLIL